MTASMSVCWHDAANQMAGDKHFEGLDLGSIFTGDQAQFSTCHACNKGYSSKRIPTSWWCGACRRGKSAMFSVSLWCGQQCAFYSFSTCLLNLTIILQFLRSVLQCFALYFTAARTISGSFLSSSEACRSAMPGHILDIDSLVLTATESWRSW